MRNVAVVLAGGSGHRMGAPLPKQFMPLAGRTVIEYSIDAFHAHPAISGVGVVVHPSFRPLMQQLADRNGWSKWLGIVEGGAERYLSSWAAVQAFGADDDTNLWLHDAARPLIDATTIGRVAEALTAHEAVAVAVPSVDTMLCVRESTLHSVPPRAEMWCAQTPQSFRASLLRQAYNALLRDPDFVPTDDCGVVRHYLPHVPIHIVEGNSRNFKLTRPEDMRRAEWEIQYAND